MDGRRIVVIGAAGAMMRVAVEWFGSHNPQYRLGLYDLRPDALEEVVRSVPAGQERRTAIDLFDPVMVREAVAGADLVVLGAGPYLRTAEPVLAACIGCRVDNLDFDDDVESTRTCPALGDRAREAGIACFIGCGISPGVTNVLGADVADQLDQVETLDVCWVTGDEGARPYGAAVIEHVLHICTSAHLRRHRPTAERRQARGGEDLRHRRGVPDGGRPR